VHLVYSRPMPVVCIPIRRRTLAVPTPMYSQDFVAASDLLEFKLKPTKYTAAHILAILDAVKATPGPRTERKGISLDARATNCVAHVSLAHSFPPRVRVPDRTAGERSKARHPTLPHGRLGEDAVQADLQDRLFDAAGGPGAPCTMQHAPGTYTRHSASKLPFPTRSGRPSHAPLLPSAGPRRVPTALAAPRPGLTGVASLGLLTASEHIECHAYN
jgi:hypothetical protein